MNKERQRKKIIREEKQKLKQMTKIGEEIKEREKEIKEIEDYLDQRSGRFKKLLEEIKHILKMYQYSSEGKRAICILRSNLSTHSDLNHPFIPNHSIH